MCPRSDRRNLMITWAFNPSVWRGTEDADVSTPRMSEHRLRRSAVQLAAGRSQGQAFARARARRRARRRSAGARGRPGAARRRAAAPRSADRAPAQDSGSLRLPVGRASRRARGRDEDGDGRGLRGGDLLSPLRRGQGRRHGAAGDHRARLRFDRLRPGRIARAADERCPALLGKDVRVLHAPCVGRCETAPVAVVGQNPVPHATAEKVVGARQGGRGEARHARTSAITPGTSTTPRTAPAGGYALAAACVSGERTPADVIALMEDSGLRGLGGAGFPAGRKWKLVVGRTGAAPDGDQHRRRRAGHVQGSLLPRARSAPVPRRRDHRRVGGRHRRRLHLPARRVSRLPRHPRARARGAAGRIRRARFPSSISAAAPAPTSAAKSPR